ncbi:MAG: MBL fold metallo-hydrolase [Methanobacterium sp.]|nr:MBL fold metallo-hydrolase [Methanobacterium sp.]
MKITPLAFESLGVRSMATYIETDQRILVDPSTSLGPKRFGLPPWKTEFDALYQTRADIQEHAHSADIVTISHYHHDHYTPFSLDRFLDSNPKYAEEIYRNKKLFIKNPESQINKSQQQRAKKLLKDLKDINSDISFCDGNSYQVGDTELTFSNPLPHGPKNSKLGFVVGLTIHYKEETLMHASDVQGPIYDKTKDYILKENPDILILSGPPIYLLGFALSKEEIEKARANLTELCNEIPQVVVDHHLLRDFRGFDFIKSVQENTDNQITVASQLIGKEPNLLEARRKEFYLE